MLRSSLLFIFINTAAAVFAQLSGTASVPGTYSTIGAALAALNSSGVSAHFTLYVAAGHTETASAGGYSLAAGGSATAGISIRKNGNGANPVIYAPAGTKTPGAATQDGIFRIVGADYITVDGLDFVDPNTSGPAMMEYGVGFFKADSTNGCQHNTIRNCHITLNRSNNSGGTGPAGDGSRGIEVVCALPAAHTSVLNSSGIAAGNSFNRIENNVITDCNVGIVLTGNSFISGSQGLDSLNEVTGNVILNFGGGGNSSAAAGIRCVAQYQLLISGNRINSNDGGGVAHVTTLRGIHLLDGPGATGVIEQNTVTVHGGGTGSQLAAIVNESGTGGTGNIVIRDNLVTDCSYAGAVNGSFYGIWNSADVPRLRISGNRLTNNSTGATGGSTYLLYNNGAVGELSVRENTLSIRYNGVQSYSGTAYGIYNSAALPAATVNVAGNVFRDFYFVHQPGAGNLYFLNNTASCSRLQIDSNHIHDLILAHNGPVYMIHNSSATTDLLTVRHNSVVNVSRSGAANHMYGYYGAASAPGTAKHLLAGNLLSGITAAGAGTGNFYGIYSAEGNVSPYPQKTIVSNTVENVHVNGSGVFYGIYATDLGNAGDTLGSFVAGNIVRNCLSADNLYGLYCAGPVSPSLAATIAHNRITGLTSQAGSAYGAYLGSNNAGVSFQSNRISGVSATGSASSAYGLYGAGTTTSNIINNIIGHVESQAGGANRSNGIYISGGTLVHLVYNTVLMQSAGTGSNAGSNALYTSSAATLALNNNIFVNKSAVSGSGIAAAYRRSTSGMTGYLTSSDHNLYYTNAQVAGTPVFYNGTSYSSMSAFQGHVSPREVNSVHHDPVFVSTVAVSPNYLHISSFPATPAESGAAAHPLVSLDADQEPRHGNSSYAGNGTAPDIGADEFTQQLQPCATAIAPAVVPLSASICAGQSLTLFSPASGAGADVMHSWEVSASPAGSFSPTGVTGFDFLSVPQGTGVFYYRLVSTCTTTSHSAASQVVTVVITPVPVPAAVASSTLVCELDSFMLSATGGTGQVYHWLGPDGFSSWDQQVVIRRATLLHAGQYSVSAVSNGCRGTSPAVTVQISQVTASLTAGKNFLCAGDTTVLQLSGNAVSYTWSSGAPLPSVTVSPGLTTVYTCSVTNVDGCSAVRTVTIGVLVPTISAVSSTVCGHSQAATVAVLAFAQSTVQWYASPGSTLQLGTGNTFTLPGSASATVYAQAAGACLSPVVPVQLLVAPLPTVAAIVSPTAVCPSATATISLSGAHNYTWVGMKGSASVVVTPSVNSSYTVKAVSVAGCSATAMIPVTVYPVPALSITPAAYAVCPASKLTMTADGAVSYTWNTGSTGKVATVTPVAGTNFTVYGSSADGCVSEQTIAIATKSVPVVSVTCSVDSVCPGEPVQLFVSGALSYTWLPVSGQGNSVTVYPQVSSVYNVIGTAANTCTQVGFVHLRVLPCAGQQEILSGPIRIFPNPSAGVFTVHLFYDNNTVKIADCFGRLLFTARTDQRVVTVDLAAFPAGVYLLEAVSANGFTRARLIRQ